MKDAPYWVAVIAGIVVILVIFVIMKRKKVVAMQEPFVGETALETYFEGDSSTIPSKDKVYIYLSSFSSTQSDRSTSIFSGSGVPIWRSLVNEDVLFNVIGTDLPSSIKTGLPMKGTRLVGPPSENAAAPNTGYVLPSFTVAWYAKWKSLDFDTEAPIILFRMFAENPNHVQLSVREVDSNTVSFDAVVGNASSTYSWNIPKTTLLTQGAGTLYTFIYNREEKKISFNIGSSIKYPRVLTESTIVKLGNTPMDINFNQNWDADLKAFMFYRDALVDMPSIDNYMAEQASGKTQLLSTVDVQKAELEQTLQSCALNDEELAGLRDELNLTREQLYNIRMKLRACTQPPENIDPATFRRWQIKDGLYPGQYTNLEQCKELDIKNLDDIKSRLARTLIDAFVRPIKDAVSKPTTSAPATTAAPAAPPTAQTTTKPKFPPTLYTTFPNDGFKKETTDPKSTYLPTPYPEQPATEPWKLKEFITKYGQQEPIQQATIATAQLLPSSGIPTATLLPRPETSSTGLTLVYGDQTKTDTVTGAQYTSSIATPATAPATTSATVTATAPTGIVDKVLSWFN